MYIYTHTSYTQDCSISICVNAILNREMYVMHWMWNIDPLPCKCHLLPRDRSNVESSQLSCAADFSILIGNVRLSCAHAHCSVGRFTFRLRPPAAVTRRIATFEYLPVTNWDTALKKILYRIFFFNQKGLQLNCWGNSAIDALWDRRVTWPRLANGSEPSAAEVCSLFGYFANFVFRSLSSFLV